MENNTNYVKCQDCGRRLPGPERKCDVCGGRMTRKTANSYYTPDGVISRKNYERDGRNTPDGTKDFGFQEKTSSTRTSAPKTDYTTPSNQYMQSSSNPKKTPVIDRVGDVIDVLGSTDELGGDTFEQLKKAVTGEPVKWKNISNNSDNANQTSQAYGGTASPNYQQDNEEDEKKNRNAKIFTAVIVVVVLLVLVPTILDAFSTSYYDDYNDGESYSGIVTDATASADHYDLQMEDVYFYEDETGSFCDYVFRVTIKEGQNLNFMPYENIGLLPDDTGASISYITVFPKDTENGDSVDLYNDTDVYEMVQGQTYEVSVSMNANDLDFDEFTFIHNIGGNLDDRDESTDITIENDRM